LRRALFFFALLFALHVLKQRNASSWEREARDWASGGGVGALSGAGGGGMHSVEVPSKGGVAMAAGEAHAVSQYVRGGLNAAAASKAATMSAATVDAEAAAAAATAAALKADDAACAEQLGVVGPGRHCPPRHRQALEPPFLQLNGMT